MHLINLLTLDTVSGSAYIKAMYSVKEAAQKLKISEQHLRYLLSKGEIAGKKVSRDWVVLSLDYKRKRKPKRKAEPRQVVTAVDRRDLSINLQKPKKVPLDCRFEIQQLVKVITQDTPYRNLSGRVVEIAKQQRGYCYWVEFSWPPQGYPKTMDFMEDSLVSPEDFFKMRGT